MHGRRLKIGELSRLTGKSVRALHLYEEMGLLHPVERSKGGFRLYGAESVVRVKWIAHLNDLGFSLHQIQGFRHDWEGGASGPQSMGYVRGLYREKLAETRAQIDRLRALTRELEASLEYLETCGTVCDEHTHAVSACSQCDVGGPDRVGSSPSLVAGFFKG